MKIQVEFAAFECVVPDITPDRCWFLGRTFGEKSVHSYLCSEAVTRALEALSNSWTGEKPQLDGETNAWRAERICLFSLSFIGLGASGMPAPHAQPAKAWDPVMSFSSFSTWHISLFVFKQNDHNHYLLCIKHFTFLKVCSYYFIGEKLRAALAGVAYGLSTSLRTKRLPVRLLVRAHAWVAGRVPSKGCARGNYTLVFPSLSPSFPLSLKINKILKK